MRKQASHGRVWAAVFLVTMLLPAMVSGAQFTIADHYNPEIEDKALLGLIEGTHRLFGSSTQYIQPPLDLDSGTLEPLQPAIKTEPAPRRQAPSPRDRTPARPSFRQTASLDIRIGLTPRAQPTKQN